VRISKRMSAGVHRGSKIPISLLIRGSIEKLEADRSGWQHSSQPCFFAYLPKFL
jgi:hypothetical protein